MKYKIFKIKIVCFVHCGCERSAVIGIKRKPSKLNQTIYQELQQVNYALKYYNLDCF